MSTTVAGLYRRTDWARYYRLSRESQASLDLYGIYDEHRGRRESTYPLYRQIRLFTIVLSDGELHITQASIHPHVIGELRYKGFFAPSDGQTRNIEGSIQFLSGHTTISLRN